jgi:hypothetical protein
LADAITDWMAFEISNRNSNVVAYTVTDSFTNTVTDSFTNTVTNTTTFVANETTIR